jgi:hypothetical protein
MKSFDRTNQLKASERHIIYALGFFVILQSKAFTK